ncbi:MFS general substrate transporter [Mycena sanguinolenta]|uniref:MFS general substrate transporter n=1 Tax=Mycena sanguinolenta TaxID=230812 RepID=A0A8H6X653_9AGAR|nr:MFS general substrate transporter [Mycena sanguinolenta]
MALSTVDIAQFSHSMVNVDAAIYNVLSPVPVSLISFPLPMAHVSKNDDELDSKIPIGEAAQLGTWTGTETVTATQTLGGEPHAYVKDLDYSAEEESRVVRILDTRLFPWILLTTFVLNMDRTNNSNAISDNLPADLGFTIDTVNTATAIYAVFFSIFSFSGAVMAKIFGPARWIPILMFAWGLVTMSHALIKDRGGYITVRIFIAVTEGGVIPATLIYLGGFYKSTELSTRLGWFWGSRSVFYFISELDGLHSFQAIASAVSGLMASGLLQLGGRSGLEGWKWLFLVDGIITVFVAVVIWFYLPRNVASTRGGLRGAKPWFTDRQIQIAVTRVIRDDQAKREYEKRVTRADFKDAATDLGLWGHLLLSNITLTPTNPLSTYLPTVIKSFKFNVFVSNALTAPPYILQCIFMVIVIRHSDKVRERGFHGAFGSAWQLVGWIILRAMPDSASRGVKYFGAIVVASWPYNHPLNIGWMSENTGSVGKRTVASGAVSRPFKCQTHLRLISPNLSPSLDFKRGNSINIAFAGFTTIMWVVQKYYYRHLNKKREHEYAALSESEKLEEDSQAEKKGNRSLTFRFTT